MSKEKRDIYAVTLFLSERLCRLLVDGLIYDGFCTYETDVPRLAEILNDETLFLREISEEPLFKNLNIPDMAFNSWIPRLLKASKTTPGLGEQIVSTIRQLESQEDDDDEPIWFGMIHTVIPKEEIWSFLKDKLFDSKEWKKFASNQKPVDETPEWVKEMVVKLGNVGYKVVKA
jgi:hypothetical protein